jgi:O-antigen/teichoic acid export membrane protein
LILFEIINVSSFFILGLILFYFSEVLKSNYQNKLSAERQQYLFALWSMIDIFLVFIFAIAALLLIHKSSFWYITGQGLGILVTALIFIPVIKKKLNIGKSNFNYEFKQKIFLEFKAYGLPFIQIAIIIWMLSLGNRYILNHYSTLVEVGIFTAAFSISSRPFLFISGTISSFFRPILFQAASENNKHKARIITTAWFILVILTGIIFLSILFIAGDLIAFIFLAKNYHTSVNLLFLSIGTGFFFVSISHVIENRFFSFEKSKLVLYCNFIALIAFLFSNIFFIESYGLIGAGIAVAVTYLVQLVSGIYLLKTQTESV